MVLAKDGVVALATGVTIPVVLGGGRERCGWSGRGWSGCEANVRRG